MPSLAADTPGAARTLPGAEHSRVPCAIVLNPVARRGKIGQLHLAHQVSKEEFGKPLSASKHIAISHRFKVARLKPAIRGLVIAKTHGFKVARLEWVGSSIRLAVSVSLSPGRRVNTAQRSLCWSRRWQIRLISRLR